MATDSGIINVIATTNTGDFDKQGWSTTIPLSFDWVLAEPIVWPKITINSTEEDVPKNKLPEGVEMKKLFDVYMIYAEDRKKPEVFKEEGVIANNEEDAKIKSGLMKEISERWNSDYLTFICNEIGEVKVKERPKEVKNI